MPAVYNPATDKIIGAAKGSAAWWHERGHQVLHQRTGYQWVAYSASSQLEAAALILLCFDMRILALVCVLCIVLMRAFDECFAWAYALRFRKFWHKNIVKKG
jgi:hypothetical protein